MATTKANLYRLIEQLPESATRLAEKMLQAMIAEFPQETDSKTRLLAMLAAAPQDDEQLTQEELAAINQSRASISRGEGITLDELKKELDS